MKWSEGRTSIFGFKSAAGKRRVIARAEKASGVYAGQLDKEDSLGHSNSHSNSQEGGETKEGAAVH